MHVENVTVREEDPLPLRAGDYVKISIADRGVGIAEEDLHRIFDPFFTTKDGGTGLGLSTSFSIVKKHGGHIHAASGPGTGTTISVYLPGSRGAVCPAKETERRPVQGRGRILLIDDDKHIRTSAGFVLKRLGYEVAFACDGREGVERFQGAIRSERPFDLVITDLTIPGGMGGLETVRRLREIDPWAKVMVASGYTNNRVLSNYREHGFSGMVAKPYRIEDLSARVHELISGAHEPPSRGLESVSP